MSQELIDARHDRKGYAADGVTKLYGVLGMPVMVRAIDFNALHARCDQQAAQIERLRAALEMYRGQVDCHGVESASAALAEGK